MTNTFFSLNEDKYITEAGLKKTQIAKEESLLMSIIDPDTNKLSISTKDTAVNQSIAIISEKNLYFEILSSMNYFKKVKNGAAQQSINKSLILESTINVSEISFNEILLKLKKINSIKLNLIELKKVAIELLIK
ncbi:hypothetical protein [Mesoplasma melaleucae]|uniref:Uncharacterized protein n=1 Tax=Mesoplasma melaleucae TaxID=81459 RepID=A0A2K8NW40_9MOLU|nr:hypothetical protein [Mesoplasma melaleucae]ATZ17977.1 hypothetical protein EMELA_v1c04250 [Mesoplasma melaleucae]